MDTLQESPTLISLCTGMCGLDEAISECFGTITVLAYSEIEGYATANLCRLMEQQKIPVAPIWTDLKTFPVEPFRNIVDILTGGFPCQPFSAAGQRKADEDPRHLFPSILRIVEEIQPQFVFLENVEGIISAKIKSDGWADPVGTPVLFHVLRELERRGYKATAGIFSAEEVGAPHRRKRVFILAHNNDALWQQSRWSIGPDREGAEELGIRSEILANTNPSWEQQLNLFEEEIGNGPVNSSQEVADTISERSQRHDGDVNEEGRQEGSREDRPITEGSFSCWPARPGEQQYDWEEPRIVDDSTGRRCQQREPLTEETENSSHSDGETQPELGGAVDGSTRSGVDPIANRVDRLRLLGNAVVIPCAEKAFRTLYRQLIQDYFERETK